MCGQGRWFYYQFCLAFVVFVYVYNDAYIHDYVYEDGYDYEYRYGLASNSILPVFSALKTMAAVHIKNKSPRYLQLPSGHTPHFF